MFTRVVGTFTAGFILDLVVLCAVSCLNAQKPVLSGEFCFMPQCGGCFKEKLAPSWIRLNNEVSERHCAVCMIFSYEATVYEHVLLDMCIPPFSYPHPFSISFPTLSCFFGELKTTTVQAFVRETFPGNSVSHPF
jgi:hypothetical protein